MKISDHLMCINNSKNFNSAMCVKHAGQKILLNLIVQSEVEWIANLFEYNPFNGFVCFFNAVVY